MHSVAGQEERRKVKSRRRRTERVESRKEEQKEAGKSRTETTQAQAGHRVQTRTFYLKGQYRVQTSMRTEGENLYEDRG
jgi:hypothetical protein